MKNKTVRIKDIAKEAKVSTGTVDRVIHKRGKVAIDVEKRVLAIINKIGYEPNMVARVLGTHKNFRFAALIPDPIIDSYWQAPKDGIEKAERELLKFGISVSQFLFDPHIENNFAKQASLLTATKPDGILLAPIFYQQVIPYLKKWNLLSIPFVMFNTHIEEYSPLGYIGQDSYQSGMIAGKLLHFGNYKPCTILIAHIDEELSNAAHLEKKEQGFRKYFESLKDYRIIKCELNRSDKNIYKKLDKIFADTVDINGIFVTTSKAFEIAEYLERRKLYTQRLVGFDLLEENVHFLNKGIIHFLINQHPKGQGYWGIYHLADHLVYKKKVGKLKYLPLDIVTKENCNYYLKEEDIVK